MALHSTREVYKFTAKIRIALVVAVVVLVVVIVVVLASLLK